MWFTQHHEQVYNYNGPVPQEHKASLTHEVLGGAVGFFAMKAYEDHQRKLGHPVHHQFAKEILAAIAVAEVDRLVETKGMNWIDKQQAKRHATQQAQQMYDQQYAGQQMQQYDKNAFDWQRFQQHSQQYQAPLGQTFYQQSASYQQYPGQGQAQDYSQTMTYQYQPPAQYGGQQGYFPQQYPPQQYGGQQGYPPQQYPPQQYGGQQYPQQGEGHHHRHHHHENY